MPALILPILILAGFYLLVLRPQQRRVRAHQALTQAVRVGDEVVTAGGIFGEVTGLDDNEVTLRVAPGVELRILRSMVSQRVPTSEPDDGAAAEAAEEEPG
ncbi:MAG: preprotein translocase subunit YajC [Acidimicrobiales bacterium]